MSAEMRVCFLVERQVGIGSAAAAIEPYLRNQPGVAWKDVTYWKPDGWLERLPSSFRARGVLRGLQQTSSALKGSYDSLFFLTHNPAVLQQLAIRRTPTLLWTDVTPALLDDQAEQYDHPIETFAPSRWAKDTLVRHTFKAARLCIGWSSWAKDSFVRDYGVEESKTLVVPPGIDLDRFQLAAGPSNHGLPRLLFVGGDFLRKGGDLLLEVFRSHFRGRCELDLVTRDAVEQEEGVLVHRGLSAGSPALVSLFDAATAFVLPTRGDCFSIASLEAMAKGLPVVVSGVGGIPEIVEEGQSGFLLGGARGEDLRAAIEQLLADAARARSMGKRGRQIVEERFSAKLTAQRLLELSRQYARKH
jgi:glycosyltransferase involved in cell wall biosynthesis